MRFGLHSLLAVYWTPCSWFGLAAQLGWFCKSSGVCLALASLLS